MNILYTITSYPPAIGGTQLHTHLLAKNLQAEHTVNVITHWDTSRTDWLLGTTLRAPSIGKNYLFEGIPVHRLGVSFQDKAAISLYLPIYYPLMKVALPPITSRLEKYILPLASGANVIHNIRQGREGLSYASLKAARHYNIPFIFTPTHHPRWNGWRYEAYIQLYREADMIIALTEAEKRLLNEFGVREDRIVITGIGPVLADTADPQGFLEDYNVRQPFVLFLARHQRYKGYLELLKATKLVWQKVPEANFVFIGPSVGQSEHAFRSFQDPRIHRLGKTDLQVKTNALAACTLLCVPSTQESFGGIYTEAWNFAKPVIGCAIPAVKEVITDGVDGYLVQQNSQQIADRICQLLLNPNQSQFMGKNGNEKVKSRYSWQRIAKKTAEAYSKAFCS